MSNQHDALEEAYDNMSYNLKEATGFPPSFIFLTREQESFIIELYNRERQVVKRELLETVEDLKGLINEI